MGAKTPAGRALLEMLRPKAAAASGIARATARIMLLSLLAVERICQQSDVAVMSETG